MTRVPVCLLGLALVASLVPLAAASLPARERAYSVDEVQAGLARQPAAWIGRTILVQAEASNQGALLSCWRATAPVAHFNVRALCPTPGTLTLSLAPTSSWVAHLGPLALRLTAPPLIVAHQADATPPVSAGLTVLVAPLAQIPLLAPLAAALVSHHSALYHVRLLGPGRCDLPPAPCPQALTP